jgi:hypothetical protein
MNKLLTAVNSKIVWVNFITTLIEISAVVEGVIPAKYLVYTTSAKSVLTIIMRVWFNQNDPPEFRVQPKAALFSEAEDL